MEIETPAETEDSDGKTNSTIPTVEAFSEELIEALDPENGIEEEYMPYHSSVGFLD